MRYKKFFKIKNRPSNVLNDKLYSGCIGLKSLKTTNLTVNQLSAAIKSLKRIIKKKNFLIIRTTPFRFLTAKPRDVRMGRGKGNPTHKVFPIKAGMLIFELKSIALKNSTLKALRSCSLRLPFSTKIISKNDKHTNTTKSFW